MIVDYWCNLFTHEAFRRYWHDQPEVAEVLEWWHLTERVTARSVEQMISELDDAGVDHVLVPAAKMCSYRSGQLIWDVDVNDVVEVVAQRPDRLHGLFGIDPRSGLQGVRQLELAVREHGFVGAHLHSYGFGLALNDRRLYSYFAKCAELSVPVVAQIGHSAERMPSALGRPLLLDDVALDLPELTIIGAHTGWPWIEEAIALAWKHRNVYIGTSAHHPRYWSSALVDFANGRGRGKVLYGTDFPVLDHRETLDAIRCLDLRDDARQLLLGDVAAELFGLCT